MALVTFGLAAECKAERVAFNCLWPKTVIQTAALALLPGFRRRLEARLIKPALPLPIGIGAPSLDTYACVAKEIKNPLLALL
jgi:hypothetical protein